jgi:uncharacterized protein (TIGR02246 family)
MFMNDPDADELQLRHWYTAWENATRSGDLPRLLDMLDNEVIFLVNGKEPFGKKEFAATFTAGRTRHQLDPKSEIEELTRVKDHAFLRIREQVRVSALDGSIILELAGYSLSIFRQSADGRWLLWRDASMLTPRSGS